MTDQKCISLLWWVMWIIILFQKRSPSTSTLLKIPVAFWDLLSPQNLMTSHGLGINIFWMSLGNVTAASCDGGGFVYDIVNQIYLKLLRVIVSTLIQCWRFFDCRARVLEFLFSWRVLSGNNILHVLPPVSIYSLELTFQQGENMGQRSSCRVWTARIVADVVFGLLL